MIKYIVNEEKRTVVALIEFEENEQIFKESEWVFDNIATVNSILGCNNKFRSSKAYNKMVKKMFFPRYMSAKAKCDPRDEWNEEYGKNLARQRLVEKIHSYRNNGYKIIADLVEEIKDYVM